jgi:hypothetical protein
MGNFAGDSHAPESNIAKRMSFEIKTRFQSTQNNLSNCFYYKNYCYIWLQSVTILKSFRQKISVKLHHRKGLKKNISPNSNPKTEITMTNSSGNLELRDEIIIFLIASLIPLATISSMIF